MSNNNKLFILLVIIFLSLNCGTPLSNEEIYTPGIDPNPPAPPQNFSIYPDNNLAILTWDFNKETDISGYQIYKSTLFFETFIPIINISKDTNYFYDTSVLNGNKYYYYIRSYDINNNISDSTPIKRVAVQKTAHPDQNAFYTVTFTGNPATDFGNYIIKDGLGDVKPDGSSYGDIDEIFLRYDAENLYLAVIYTKYNNGDLIWMIDTDEDIGAKSQKNLDFFGDQRHINYPNNYMRLMISSWAGAAPSIRLIDDNYSTNDITSAALINHSVDNNTVSDEISIPFNSIYGFGPGKVPLLSKIHLVVFTSVNGNYGFAADAAPDIAGDVTGDNSTDLDFKRLYTITVDKDGK